MNKMFDFDYYRLHKIFRNYSSTQKILTKKRNPHHFVITVSIYKALCCCKLLCSN